jgi:predicted nucleotidyltransferase
VKDLIIKTVLKYYPDVQAVYLFGSFETDQEWADSDVDIGLLLDHEEAKEAGSLMMSDLHGTLVSQLKRDVDLVNLRQVSTVFQKEAISAERRVYCANEYAADEFEMLTLSFYQKLNEERKAILAEFNRTGKAYPV